MDKDRVKAFTQRVFQDMAGAMTAGLAFLGTRTGLFRAMAGRGPMGLDQVVAASGLEARYVEEWLKGMVCAGYLEYDAEHDTYELPEEHAYLLASDGTDHFAGGLFHMAPVLLGVAPEVAESFRQGGGVRFEEYGEEGTLALDLINRGNYEHRFADYWLGAVPDVRERLRAGARALDVGCGAGRVPIALAKAFPRSHFVGVDPHEGSVARAREAAAREGVAERVDFVVGTVDAVAAEAAFDLVTLCDCLHDLEQPLEVLQGIRARLRADGTLFVIEPKVADHLKDNRTPVATMFYGFSVFHCMTQSLAKGGPGLGACLGPGRTAALVHEAGFGRCERLDIKSQVNLFYAVRP